MNRNDLCLGCATARKENSCIISLSVPIEFVEKCPCQDCLIKLMCNDGCSEIKTYYEKIIKPVIESRSYAD